MRYRRNPVEVDAILWNGYDGVYEIIEEMVAPVPIERQANDSLAIHLLSGTKVAHFGDYVCRDVIDENVFVMKPDGFKLAYEPVEEESDGA